MKFLKHFQAALLILCSSINILTASSKTPPAPPMPPINLPDGLDPNDPQAMAEIQKEVQKAIESMSPEELKELETMFEQALYQGLKELSESEREEMVKTIGISNEELENLEKTLSEKYELLEKVDVASEPIIDTEEISRIEMNSIARELQELISLLQKAIFFSNNELVSAKIDEDTIAQLEASVYYLHIILNSPKIDTLLDEKYQTLKENISKVKDGLRNIIDSMTMPDVNIEEPYSQYGLPLMASQEEIQKVIELIEEGDKKEIEQIKNLDITESEKKDRIKTLNKKQKNLKNTIRKSLYDLLKSEHKEEVDQDIEKQQLRIEKQIKSLNKKVDNLLELIQNDIINQNMLTKLEDFIKAILPEEYKDYKQKREKEIEKEKELDQAINTMGM